MSSFFAGRSLARVGKNTSHDRRGNPHHAGGIFGYLNPTIAPQIETRPTTTNKMGRTNLEEAVADDKSTMPGHCFGLIAQPPANHPAAAGHKLHHVIGVVDNRRGVHLQTNASEAELPPKG